MKILSSRASGFIRFRIALERSVPPRFSSPDEASHAETWIPRLRVDPLPLSLSLSQFALSLKARLSAARSVLAVDSPRSITRSYELREMNEAIMISASRTARRDLRVLRSL